jgi:hypothetical protein
VPVLARTLEAAGLSTLTLTMMPGYAERAGTPRIVGVEFPFGHPVGPPGEVELQLAVLRDALAFLSDAATPNSRRDLPYEWPVEQSVAYKAWQPREPSPIVGWFREQALLRRGDDTEP